MPPITTQDAIDLINTLIEGCNNNIDQWQKTLATYQVVLASLQGTLDTPSADLVAANETIDTLQSQVAEVREPASPMLSESADVAQQ